MELVQVQVGGTWSEDTGASGASVGPPLTVASQDPGTLWDVTEAI